MKLLLPAAATASGLLLLLLLVFVPLAHSQDLSSSILSITNFPACSSSQLFKDKNLNLPIVTGDTLGKAGTTKPAPCDLIGRSEQVTEIVLELSPNQEAPGEEVLMLKMTGLPSPLKPVSSADPLNPCGNTQSGDTCTVPQYGLEVSYTTSNAVAVYALTPQHLQIPYAYYVYECKNITFTKGSPPISGRYHWIFNPPVGGLSGVTQAAGLNQYVQGSDTVTFPDIDCINRMYPSVGPINNLDTGSVCPGAGVLGDDVDVFYPAPDQIKSSVEPQSVLMCPNPANQMWTSMFLTTALPTCQIWTINPNPVFLMAITIYLRAVQYTGPIGDPTSTRTVVSESTIELTTLQNGAMQLDEAVNTMAAVVTTDLATSISAQPLTGDIFVCGTDPIDINKQHRPGLISDVLAADPTMADLTENPWRANYKKLKNCVVPLPECRRRLKQDPDITAGWGYFNPIEASINVGRGWNQNGMSADIYAQRTEIGDLMCRAGLSGNGVPGYQQSSAFSQRQATPTICQKYWTAAKSLAGDNPTLQTYSYMMPGNFNPVNPNLWMHEDKLLSDLQFAASLQSHTRVAIYAPGTFLGSLQITANGQFVNQSMQCNAVQGQAMSGAISFAIYNPNSIPGNFRVELTFVLPDSASAYPPSKYLTDNTVPVVLTVPPLSTSAMQVISGFGYTGPDPDQLGGLLSMYSDVVSAFGDNSAPIASIIVTCSVSKGIDDYAKLFGQSTGAVDDTNDFQQRQKDREDCYAVDLTCWHGGLLFWLARLSFLFLIALGPFVLIPLIVCYTCRQSMNERRKANLMHQHLELKRRQNDEQQRVNSSIQKTSDAVEKISTNNTDEHLQHQLEILENISELRKGMNAGGSSSSTAVSPPVPVEEQGINLVSPTGSRANYVSHTLSSSNINRAGKYSWSLMFALMIVSMMLGLVQAEVRVLSVNSFQETVFVDAQGNSQNFTSSEFATSIQLQVIPDSTVTTSRFAVKLTVVPTTAQAQQLGFSDVCQSQGSDLCQVTIPAEITVEAMPSLWQSKLIPISLQSSTNAGSQSFHVPYNYIFQSNTSLDYSDDLSDYTCSYSGMTTGQHSATSSNPITPPSQTQVNSAFVNADKNYDHFRCPLTAPPPTALGSEYGSPFSYLEYLFRCTSPTKSTKVMSLTMMYGAMRPFCRVWTTSNPPVAISVMRVNVTVPELKDPATGQVVSPAHTESLIVQSTQQGLLGASNVSEPYRLVSAQIAGRLSASASRGPYFPGYVVTCDDDDQGDPGVLNMEPNPDLLSPQMRKEYLESINPSFVNVWRFSPDAINGQYLMPVPENMGYMTGNAPHGFFMRLNMTQFATVGTQCGQLGWPAGQYAAPPFALEYTSLVSYNSVAIPIRKLIPKSQGGLGEFSQVLTCVPPFGVGFLDINVTTPCQGIGDMQALQTQIDAMLAAGEEDAVRRLFLPHLDPLYNIPQPGEFVRDGYFYTDLTSSNVRSGFNSAPQSQLSLLLSGQFVGYLTPKPRGTIETSNAASDGNTYCSLTNSLNNPPVFGGAYYRLCNPSFKQSSYQLVTQCGWRSEFDDLTWTFSSNQAVLDGGLYTTTLRMESRPQHLTFVSVPPNSCVNVMESSGGHGPVLLDGFFEVQTGDATQPATASNVVSDGYADSTFLFDNQDNSRIACAMRLFAVDTVDPLSVILDQKLIVCPIEVVQSQFSSIIPSVTVIPIVEPSHTPSPTPSPSPKPDTGGTGEFWADLAYFIIAGAAIILVVSCFVLCCQQSRVKKYEKENLTGNYKKPKPQQ